MKERNKKILKYSVSLAVAGVLLYFSFRGVKWEDFIDGLKECRWEFIALSMIASIIAFWLRGLRWRQILLPIDPSTTRLTAFNAVNIGYIANFVFPRIGEFVRCGVISSRGRATYDRVLGTVVLERGWDLVVTRWIGLGGTAALAKRREGELKEDFPPALIERATEFEIWMSVEREAKIIGRYGSCVMHDLSQGGIFGGLWELGERWKFGMEVDLKKIPIRQETVEICEYFQVNPYNLYSGGSLIAGTEHGEDLVRELEREGIPAVCIGKILKEKARKIYNGEECRFLDRPAQDEWYRLQERFDLKTRRETE